MSPEDHPLALLPGEPIETVPLGAMDSATVSDSEIDARYVSAEVRIVVEQARYPLKQIPDIVKSADYNLQPDFQRRPRWSREKQSRLIESLIMNVPIPPVFLYEVEFGRYEVMDGRQRLTAITDYYSDDFELEGLTEWHVLNGRKYSGLPEQIRRGIDRRFLSAILLLHETAKSEDQANTLKQLVFERINTGGEDLSSQEKRNALFPGAMNKLCVKLARTPSFCSMWQIPPPEDGEDLDDPDWKPPADLAENDMFRTMEDAELVLRFFSHRQRLTLWKGGTRFDDYLTFYQKSANDFAPEVLQELGKLFVAAADLTHAVLGDNAFHLFRPRAGEFVWVRRPTLIAYDPIMAAFTRLLSQARQLKDKSAEIREELERFYQENVSVFDGRRTNPSDIRSRDDAFFEFLSTFVSGS